MSINEEEEETHQSKADLAIVAVHIVHRQADLLDGSRKLRSENHVPNGLVDEVGIDSVGRGWLRFLLRDGSRGSKDARSPDGEEDKGEKRSRKARHRVEGVDDGIEMGIKKNEMLKETKRRSC